MKTLERVGQVAGWLGLASLTFAGSLLRRGRVLHPEGKLYEATLVPWPGLPEARQAVAYRLAGGALVRLSAAAWKGRRKWPDILGFALRLKWQPHHGARLQPEHQDLLLATLRSPFTLLFAPFTTQVSDTHANHYFSASPFEVAGLGQVKFRLAPTESGFRLETRQYRLGSPWQPLLSVVFERELSFDQQQLRFHPFNCGQQIRPVGFINHLRLGAYGGAQSARLRETSREDAVLTARRNPEPSTQSGFRSLASTPRNNQFQSR